MFVVFDLDGTIANIDHRTHYVRGGNRDWKSFFTECVYDKGVGHVIETFHAHLRAGQSPTECIRARIAANCNSSAQVEECRPLHNAKWSLS